MGGGSLYPSLDMGCCPRSVGTLEGLSPRLGLLLLGCQHQSAARPRKAPGNCSLANGNRPRLPNQVMFVRLSEVPISVSPVPVRVLAPAGHLHRDDLALGRNLPLLDAIACGVMNLTPMFARLPSSSRDSITPATKYQGVSRRAKGPEAAVAWSVMQLGAKPYACRYPGTRVER